MNTLVWAALGAGLGLGVVLLFAGLSGRQVLPRSAPGAASTRVDLRKLAITVAVGAVAAVLAGAFTGWPAAALAAGVGAGWAWHARQSNRASRTELDRGEAIVLWVESIRDTLGGSADVKQAIDVASRVGPPAIAAELNRFRSRMRVMPTERALRLLAADLDHGSADLVVLTLREAMGTSGGGDVAPLLSRLASTMRAELRMRRRISVARVRIRTSAKIVTGVTAATMVMLILFAGQLLTPYGTVAGQLWLLVVFGVFGAGAWLLRSFGRLDTPARFQARETTP